MVAQNTFQISGNLGSDPEMRFTTNGNPVANISICSTPRSYDKDTQEWVDGEPLWMRGTVWGQMAEHVVETLGQGARVTASGYLQQNNWETPDGEKRSSVQMVITDIGPSLLFAVGTMEKAEGYAQKEVPARKATKKAAQRSPERRTGSARGGGARSASARTGKPVRDAAPVDDYAEEPPF